MGNVVVREVRQGDVEHLVVKMRQADINELRALGVEDFAPRVQLSVDASCLSFTATIGENVACVFGMVALGDGGGVPWMLGTDLVTANQRALMRLCKPYIQSMQKRALYLTNFVHAENHAAKRWLKRLGFSLHPAAPFGVNAAMFHCFELRGSHV